MGSGKIIADTCIWIEYFKRKSPVSNELKILLEKGRIIITGPIVFELFQGVKNKNDADVIKEVARSLPVLEINHDLWLLAGELFFDLRRKGITLPPSDVLLAAIAITNECSLFTLDRHFDHIQNLARYSQGDH
jgi:hypothetical protein